MSRGNSSAAATTLSVLAVIAGLVLFCLFFTVFLLVPFFIFIAGAIALLISERQAKAAKSDAPPALPVQPQGPPALPERIGDRP